MWSTALIERALGISPSKGHDHGLRTRCRAATRAPLGVLTGTSGCRTREPGIALVPMRSALAFAILLGRSAFAASSSRGSSMGLNPVATPLLPLSHVQRLPSSWVHLVLPHRER